MPSIVPPRPVHTRARLNGKTSFFVCHSTNRFNSVGFGSMKGIDPYIKNIAASHSTYLSIPQGCGSMEGIDPYIKTVGASHSPIRFCFTCNFMGHDVFPLYEREKL